MQAMEVLGWGKKREQQRGGLFGTLTNITAAGGGSSSGGAGGNSDARLPYVRVEGGLDDDGIGHVTDLPGDGVAAAGAPAGGRRSSSCAGCCLWILVVFTLTLTLTQFVLSAIGYSWRITPGGVFVGFDPTSDMEDAESIRSMEHNVMDQDGLVQVSFNTLSNQISDMRMRLDKLDATLRDLDARVAQGAASAPSEVPSVSADDLNRMRSRLDDILRTIDTLKARGPAAASGPEGSAPVEGEWQHEIQKLTQEQEAQAARIEELTHSILNAIKAMGDEAQKRKGNSDAITQLSAALQGRGGSSRSSSTTTTTTVIPGETTLAGGIPVMQPGGVGEVPPHTQLQAPQHLPHGEGDGPRPEVPGVIPEGEGLPGEEPSGVAGEEGPGLENPEGRGEETEGLPTVPEEPQPSLPEEGGGGAEVAPDRGQEPEVAGEEGGVPDREGLPAGWQMGPTMTAGAGGLAGPPPPRDTCNTPLKPPTPMEIDLQLLDGWQQRQLHRISGNLSIFSSYRLDARTIAILAVADVFYATHRVPYNGCLWRSGDGMIWTGNLTLAPFTTIDEDTSLTNATLFLTFTSSRPLTEPCGGFLMCKGRQGKFVAYKEEPDQPLAPRSPYPSALTLCTPATNVPMEAHRVWEWLQFHRVVAGAQHAWVYTLVPFDVDVDAGVREFVDAGVLDVTLLPRLPMVEAIGLALHDCAWRATLTSRWILLLAPEEYVQAVPPNTIPSLLAANADASWISVGAMLYDARSCRDPFFNVPDADQSSVLTVERAVFRKEKPYCSDPEYEPDVCEGQPGIRRYFANPRKSLLLREHRVEQPASPSVTLNARSDAHLSKYPGLAVEANIAVCSMPVPEGEPALVKGTIKDTTVADAAVEVRSCPLSETTCVAVIEQPESR